VPAFTPPLEGAKLMSKSASSDETETAARLFAALILSIACSVVDFFRSAIMSLGHLDQLFAVFHEQLFQIWRQPSQSSFS
jgi:hypothetical protein